jgi:hypothetical protein
MKQPTKCLALFGLQLPRLTALAVASLLLAILGFQSLTACPSFFVEDDVWFYMQIGYNLGTLGESTFDGINITSGYHLAWAGLLALVSAGTSLFSPDKSLFFLAATSAYFLLGLIAVEYFGRTAMEKAALLLFVFYPGLLMESQLLATLLLTICHFFLVEKKSPLAGIGLIAVPLVRIDATVMLLPLILYHCVRKDFRAFFWYSLCAGIGVATHFGLMLLMFGRLASVSSLMKASTSSGTNWGEIVQLNVTRYGRYELAVFVVLLVLALAAAWALRRRGEGLKILCVIAGPAAFVLVHMAANPIMRTWYFSPAMFVFALVLIRCEARVVRIAFLVFVCILAVRETRNAYFFFRDEVATSRTEQTARFLKEVRDIVPEDELIYQVDGSGYTGFFSGRRVVNGDGLMNSYAYLQRLKDGELTDYLRENRIKYVITNSPLKRPKLLNHHGLVLGRDEAEKMAESDNRAPYRAFVLWRIHDSYFSVPTTEEAPSR